MTNVIKTTKLIGFLGAFAFMGACGSDSTTTTVDAAVGAADARPSTVFNVTMTKAAEVPMACAGAGASAMGSGTVTVSGDNSTITVNVTYSGLSSAASAGHIHANVAGMNGPVVLPFSAASSPIMQTLTAANYMAATGAPADFAAFVTSLKAGGAYVNLHTAACAGGEIRGQIVP